MYGLIDACVECLRRDQLAGEQATRAEECTRQRGTPHGQTIWVTEGVGVCQRGGGSIEVIRPGDRVFFEPGENHWHGAAPTRFMTHIAMQQANDAGAVVSWGEHVSDRQYGRAPSITEGEN